MQGATLCLVWCVAETSRLTFAGKLRKQEVKIKLQKQPEMLEMLLERPHEVISQCRQIASCPSAMPMIGHIHPAAGSTPKLGSCLRNRR
jgi:hypothetical protein